MRPRSWRFANLWTAIMLLLCRGTGFAHEHVQGSGMWMQEIRIADASGDTGPLQGLYPFHDGKAALVCGSSGWIALTNENGEIVKGSQRKLEVSSALFVEALRDDKFLLLVSGGTQIPTRELISISEDGKLESIIRLPELQGPSVSMELFGTGRYRVAQINTRDKSILIRIDPNGTEPPVIVPLPGQKVGSRDQPTLFGDDRHCMIRRLDGEGHAYWWCIDYSGRENPIRLESFEAPVVDDPMGHQYASPLGDGAHMIVPSVRFNIFLVRNDGSVRNHGQPVCLGGVEVTPSDDGKYLWIKPQDPLILKVFDVAGEVEVAFVDTQSAPRPDNSGLRRVRGTFFYPIRGTSRAMFQSRTNHQLELLDATRPDLPPVVLSPELPAEIIAGPKDLTPVGWIPADGKGLCIPQWKTEPPSVRTIHPEWKIINWGFFGDILWFLTRPGDSLGEGSSLQLYDPDTGNLKWSGLTGLDMKITTSQPAKGRVWISSSLYRPSQSKVWILNLSGTGTAKGVLSQEANAIFPASDGVHAWITYNRAFTFASGVTAVSEDGTSNAFTPDVDNVFPCANPSRCWVRKANKYLFAGFDHARTDLWVEGKTGGKTISVSQSTSPQQMALGELEVTVSEPIRQMALTHNGKFQITITRPGGNTPENDLTFQNEYFKDGATATQLRVHGPAATVGRQQLELRYTDDAGSDLRFKWPVVEFQVATISWWWTPEGKAVFLWLLFLLIVVLSQTPASAAIRRYVPVASWTSLFAAGGLAGALGPFNRELFGALMVTTVPLMLAYAVVEPDVLRRLAGIFPFDFVVPIALKWPRLRRRIFADYLDGKDGLTHRLAKARKNANAENYVALPVRMIEPPAPGLLDDPAPALCDRLLGGDRGGSILIESTGGCGKSALLREIVQLAAERFRRTGRTPLPVLLEKLPAGVEKGGESVLARVTHALGRHAISPEMTRQQLDSGELLLVIDGLFETAIEPGELANCIQKYGEHTHLLIANRPQENYHHEYRSRADGWIVEPQRLDDATLAAFAKAYQPAGTRLDPHLQRVCRMSDGTYLPIVVRLALIAQAEAGGASVISSVTDLYDNAFRQLARDNTELRAKAEALCLATHWKSGLRTVASETPGHVDSIKALLEAGILVPAGRLNPISLRAAEARFFHDSMQSFLTASALFQQPDGEGWNQWLEAAGDLRFASAHSAFLKLGGTELFHLCTQLFGPRAQVRQRLESDLRIWAVENHTAISADAIMAGIPSPLHKPLQARCSVTELLNRAIDVCCQDKQNIDLLVQLYAALAPVVWPKRRVSVEHTASSTGESRSS